jgi:hypothetical protein
MLAVVKQIEDNIIVDDFSYDIGSGATTISDSTSYPYELEHADLGRPDWNESD